MAYGQSGHLAISFQNSFGTSNTNSQYHIPLVSESIAEEITQVVENNLYGRLAEAPVREGTHRISGELRCEAHPILLGVFLKAVLGQATTTAVDSAFSHEFLPVQDDWDAFAAVPPMTCEIHRDVGSAFVYSDMLGSSLTLEIAHGQLLSASMAVLGGGFIRQAAGTASFAPGRPWSWDVASASYNGNGIVDLRQITLTFDNQLAAFHTLSAGKSPQRIKREASQLITVEGTLLLQDQVLFQEYLDQSEKRLVLTFQGETVAQSYTNELTLDLPKLRLGEMTPHLTGTGLLEVNFSAKGIYDSSSGYGLRVTLVNTQPSY